MTKICVGIIGLGGAGRAHAMRFLQSKHVSEVRGYDTKEVDLGRLSRRVSVCHEFESFMSGVDAASICTPDSSHYDYIVKCLAMGKHVLVEKPMVGSYREARALQEVLRRYPHLKFAVHHQVRCVPAFQIAKRLIASKTLGDIFYIEANYWHDMRERSVAFDDWRMRGTGHSVIFGGACHPLDLVLHLFEGDNEVVEHKTYVSKNSFKEYPSYTSATTILKLRNNVVAKIHANNSVRFPGLYNLIVLGEKGSYIDGMLFKNGRFTNVLGSYNSYCDPWQKRRNWMAALWNWSKGAIDAYMVGGVASMLSKHPLFRMNPFSVYNHSRICEQIIDNFIAAILFGEPVLVGVNEGTMVVKLCEEFERDALAGTDGARGSRGSGVFQMPQLTV